METVSAAAPEQSGSTATTKTQMKGADLRMKTHPFGEMHENDLTKAARMRQDFGSDTGSDEFDSPEPIRAQVRPRRSCGGRQGARMRPARRLRTSAIGYDHRDFV